MENELTAEELKEQLEGVKSALEKSLKADSEEKIKNAEEKIAATEKALSDLKTAFESKKDDELTKTVAEIQKDLNATIKALDILQVRIKNNAPNDDVQKNLSLPDAIKKELEEKSDDLEKFRRKELPRLSLEFKAATDIISTDSVLNPAGNGVGTAWGIQYRPGIVELPNRRNHVRDFMNVLPAGPGTDFYFMKEDSWDGAPAPWSEYKDDGVPPYGEGEEGSPADPMKPQFSVKLKEANAPFEIIAGFVVVSRKALNNVQGLISFLQRKLPQRLLNVEDTQILYGNGSSPNLTGIVSVIQPTTGTGIIANIYDGLRQVLDAGHNPNIVMVTSTDFFAMLQNTAVATGQYTLPFGMTFDGQNIRILGVPVVPSPALNSGHYVIADAADGADLMVQEGIRVEFFEQDVDNVRKNLITVRVEETIALPIYGASYWAGKLS